MNKPFDNVGSNEFEKLTLFFRFLLNSIRLVSLFSVLIITDGVLFILL